jgi:hypothetical protein
VAASSEVTRTSEGGVSVQVFTLVKEEASWETGCVCRTGSGSWGEKEVENALIPKNVPMIPRIRKANTRIFR